MRTLVAILLILSACGTGVGADAPDANCLGAECLVISIPDSGCTSTLGNWYGDKVTCEAECCGGSCFLGNQTISDAGAVTNYYECSLATDAGTSIDAGIDAGPCGEFAEGCCPCTPNSWHPDGGGTYTSLGCCYSPFQCHYVLGITNPTCN